MSLTRRAAVAALCAAPYVDRARAFQRGVNFTSERWAHYGSDESLSMLGKLPEFGVDSISLVPYGMIRPGSPEVRFNPSRSMERDDGIRRVTVEAHRLGMRVMLKPQLWVWRQFVGDLEFADSAERATFFRSYSGFLRHYAELAAGVRAESLCVGTELVKLSRHADEWRRLIARARDVYRGQVTYAANFGPEFETIAFADALDFIGLNNYYPLGDDLGYGPVLAKMEAVHRRTRKAIVFTEAGYASAPNCHREPWGESRSQFDLTQQERCYRAMFEACYQQPWLEGIYLWKVGTNGFGGPEDGSHTPWGKPAMEVVRQWYRATARKPGAVPGVTARS